MAMSGGSVYNLNMDPEPVVEPRAHYPIWIEAAWADSDGTVYAGITMNRKEFALDPASPRP